MILRLARAVAAFICFVALVIFLIADSFREDKE
jgi:hypothetical protein